MKVFNLEKALAGEGIVTRDGREVTQLHKFDINQVDVLCGVLISESGHSNLITFSIDGLHANKNYDLFMETKKLSGFVNVYSDNRISRHKDKVDADDTWHERITCIDLSQFEEGHGL